MSANKGYVFDQCLPFNCCRLTCLSRLTQEKLQIPASPQLQMNVLSDTHSDSEHMQSSSSCLCVHIVHYFFLPHHSFSPLVHHSLIHQTYLLSICLLPRSLASLKGVTLINYSVMAFRYLRPCEKRKHIYMC